MVKDVYLHWVAINLNKKDHPNFFKDRDEAVAYAEEISADGYLVVVAKVKQVFSETGVFSIKVEG